MTDPTQSNDRQKLAFPRSLYATTLMPIIPEGYRMRSGITSVAEEVWSKMPTFYKQFLIYKDGLAANPAMGYPEIAELLGISIQRAAATHELALDSFQSRLNNAVWRRR